METATKKKQHPAVTTFLAAASDAEYADQEERAELEKQAKTTVWKAYSAAVAKGDLAGATELACYVRAPMDLRDPQTIALADVAAYQQYVSCIKSLATSYESSRKTRALAELIEQTCKQSLEITREARTVKSRIQTTTASLARMRSFGLDPDGDVEQIAKADREAIDQLKESVAADWTLIAVSDCGVVPVCKNRKVVK